MRDERNIIEVVREGEEVGEAAAGDGVSSLVRALVEEELGPDV